MFLFLEPHALVGVVLRPRCWIRGRHRWRVPNRALLAECSDLVVRVRCADCGEMAPADGDRCAAGHELPAAPAYW